MRSFSKLSSFDFAITVAIGSLIASTVIAENPPLLLAISALLALFVIQMFVATLRRSSSFIRTLVDNKAILLMKGERMLEKNMKKAKISRSDLLAKLREANVLELSQIHAVIMESTGDISVLHHDGENLDFDTELLDDLEEEFKSIETH
ncbi:MAG: DUF421 domain-containing protein [Balneolaceae bacterium]|nr:DUF421 domain-containing protein [Balneolaceae bacterium]